MDYNILTKLINKELYKMKNLLMLSIMLIAVVVCNQTAAKETQSIPERTVSHKPQMIGDWIIRSRVNPLHQTLDVAAAIENSGARLNIVCMRGVTALMIQWPKYVSSAGSSPLVQTRFDTESKIRKFAWKTHTSGSTTTVHNFDKFFNKALEASSVIVEVSGYRHTMTAIFDLTDLSAATKPVLAACKR